MNIPLSQQFMIDLLRDLAQRNTEPVYAGAFARAARAVEKHGVDAVRRQFAGNGGPIVAQIVIDGDIDRTAPKAAA